MTRTFYAYLSNLVPPLLSSRFAVCLIDWFQCTVDRWYWHVQKWVAFFFRGTNMKLDHQGNKALCNVPCVLLRRFSSLICSPQDRSGGTLHNGDRENNKNLFDPLPSLLCKKKKKKLFFAMLDFTLLNDHTGSEGKAPKQDVPVKFWKSFKSFPTLSKTRRVFPGILL